jgi:hypothetical protein
MLVCLKNWLDTEIRYQDHSNIYDVSEYNTLILICDLNHSNFSDFLYISLILFEIY